MEIYITNDEIIIINQIAYNYNGSYCVDTVEGINRYNRETGKKS